MKWRQRMSRRVSEHDAEHEKIRAALAEVAEDRRRVAALEAKVRVITRMVAKGTQAT